MVETIFFIYPIIAFVIGVIGYFLTKTVMFSTIITTLVFTALAIAKYNSTFFIWVAVYIAIAFFTSLILSIFFSK